VSAVLPIVPIGSIFWRREWMTVNQTRWSDTEDGRIYRYDPRAMLAYRNEARKNVNVWKAWRKIKQPILITHGMVSDALLEPTLRRMRQHKAITVMHIPNTGHAPVLDDPNHIGFIREWLEGSDGIGREFSALPGYVAS
jgi:pimeloyl-ACP methyl ester carboxylesterase